MEQTIVVCDDDAFIRRSIQLKLSRAGFDIHLCANGEEGLETCRRVQPELVVTDLQMPKLSGLELCEHLQAEPELRGLPIILLTAKGFELDRETVRERFGVHELVCKPFGPGELLDLVNATLAKAAGPEESTSDIESESPSGVLNRTRAAVPREQITDSRDS